MTSHQQIVNSSNKEIVKSRSWRFPLLLAILVLSGLMINIWQHTDEARAERLQLKAFPSRVGEWNQLGPDLRFDRETEAVLRADDYLARNYALPDGRAGSFYIGYYATQRAGVTYHSPLNCLPGSGWTFSEPKLIRIIPRNGQAPFDANRYVIQNGSDRELLIYWYQGRGRAVASEYWGKIYTVLDSVRLHRSDGAMIRVMVPVNGSEEEASRDALDLTEQITPYVAPFVPN